MNTLLHTQIFPNEVIVEIEGHVREGQRDWDIYSSPYFGVLQK